MVPLPRLDAIADLDVHDTLALAAETRAEAIRIEAQRLVLAAHYADLFAPPGHEVGFGEVNNHTRTGDDGTPWIADGAYAELALVLGLTTYSGRNLVRSAMNLRHRFPRWWEHLVTGTVEAWRLRRLLAVPGLSDLDHRQALWVDAETAEALPGLPLARAEALVAATVVKADTAAAEARRREAAARRYVGTGRSNEAGNRTLIWQSEAGDVVRLEAMVDHLADRLDAEEGESRDGLRARALGLLANPAQACLLLARTAPEQVDDLVAAASPAELTAAVGRVLDDLGGTEVLDRLRPPGTLYVHVASEALAGVPGTQVARVETDHEVIGGVTLDQARAWLDGHRIVVRPVLDLDENIAADSYEIPVRLREQLRARQPFEVFPFGTSPTRRCDLDHVVPYGVEGGRTETANLGPLGRHHHRLKTHAPGWHVHQPRAGLYFWRTPHGYWFRVDHRGTLPLGTTPPRHTAEIYSVVEQHLALLLDAA